MAARPDAGNVIGSVEAREVNATSAWLAKLVKERDLPEKLFLIHQFTERHGRRHAAAGAPGALDGPERRRLRRAGDQEGEVPRLHALAAPVLPPGFKLFYREDTDLMTPRQVLRLRPPPDVVIYE